MKRIYIGYIGSGKYFVDQVIEYLEHDYEVININNINPDSIIGREVAKQVLKDKDSFGIVICGNGFGIAKDAMIHEDIIVIPCVNTSQVKSGRLVNDANVLALGHRLTTFDVAKELIDTFLSN